MTSTAKTICVATKYRSVAELVERMHPLCDASSLFLPTTSMRNIGERRPFGLQLEDRSFVLRGWCVVLESWATRDHRFGRPGIRLRLERLTRESQHVFDALRAARFDAIARRHPDACASIVAPTITARLAAAGALDEQARDRTLRMAGQPDLDFAVEEPVPPPPRRAPRFATQQTTNKLVVVYRAPAVRGATPAVATATVDAGRPRVPSPRFIPVSTPPQPSPQPPMLAPAIAAVSDRSDRVNAVPLRTRPVSEPPRLPPPPAASTAVQRAASPSVASASPAMPGGERLSPQAIPIIPATLRALSDPPPAERPSAPPPMARGSERPMARASSDLGPSAERARQEPRAFPLRSDVLGPPMWEPTAVAASLAPPVEVTEVPGPSGARRFLIAGLIAALVAVLMTIAYVAS